MRIVRVESRRRAIPLTRPYTIARVTTSEVDLSFVRIVTDGARTGAGAANAATGVTGETADQCAEALVQAADLLEGQDPRRLPYLLSTLETKLQDCPAARAALDMALYDLFARELGLPVVDLFGRRHRSLPTSITIGIRSVEETLAEAEEYVRRGFTCLKVKTGHSVETDLERLRRLREIHGKAIRIRVDANEGYDLADTERFLAASERLELEFVEQPLPRAALESLRALPAVFRRRLALDESLHDERDALELLKEPVAGRVFVIKLMKCGGLRPALRIARLAELKRTRLMWGCMDESALGITAALHAAFAAPATRYLDLDGSLDLQDDPAQGGFVLEQGRLSLTGAPGLGVELAE